MMNSVQKHRLSPQATYIQRGTFHKYYRALQGLSQSAWYCCRCAECGEGFIENRDLVRHRTVHTGQAAFQCQECGQGFTLKASLLTHMRKKHLSHKPVACPNCSQSFPSSSALARHHELCIVGQGGSAASDAGEQDGDRVKEEPTSMELDTNDWMNRSTEGSGFERFSDWYHAKKEQKL